MTSGITALSRYSHPDTGIQQQATEVPRILGRSLKAWVFLARDPSGRLEAIKELFSKAELIAFSRYVKKYIDGIYASNGMCTLAQQEYAIGQQLHHPRIMKTYGYYFYRAPNMQIRSCLRMEFVEGSSVDKIERGAYSRKRAVQHVAQLIDTLQYIISQQFIHFDLVDENIMIGPGGVKLIDLEDCERLSSDTPSSIKVTLRQYLQELFVLLGSVLEKGAFTRPEQSFIERAIIRQIDKRKFRKILDQAITVESLPGLSPALERIKRAILHARRVPTRSYQILHPKEARMYRVFCANEMRKQPSFQHKKTLHFREHRLAP